MDRKFRGRRKDNHQLVSGYYVSDLLPNPNPYIVNENGTFRIAHSPIERSLGRPDAKGKPIFEGDILSVSYERDRDVFTIEVRFGRCGGTPLLFSETRNRRGYEGFFVSFLDPITRERVDLALRDDIHYWLDNCICEVIGNVYDKEGLSHG